MLAYLSHAMRRTPLLALVLPALLLAPLAACNDESDGAAASAGASGAASAGSSGAAGSSAGASGASAGSSGGSGSSTAGSGGASGSSTAGSGGASSVTVSPKPTSLLTCSTTTFTATGTVTWAASAGAIDATGKYTAPKVESKGVTVTATNGGASDQATFDAVTAHPAAPLTLAPSDESPAQLDRVVAARGMRVYQVSTAEAGGASPHVDLRRSDDGGKTWGAAVRVSPPTSNMDPGGRASCASLAIDPANPDVLYVVANYASGLGVGKMLAPTLKDDDQAFVLHVSEDGGKTFAHVPLQVGNSADPIPVAQGICPTVVAPAANAVFVATPGGTNIVGPDMPVDTYTWLDGNRGKGFTQESDEYNAIANPHGSIVDASADWEQNGGSAAVPESPVAFTDGKGAVCLTYLAYAPQGGGSPSSTVRVRCSPDGTTWGADATLTDAYGYGGVNQVSKPSGTFGPKGEIAVVATVLSPTDGMKGMPFAISTDGGKMWTKGFVPPPPQGGGGVAIVPTISSARYDADGTLWVAYHADAGGDQERIFVDKTCDAGVTWSGAVRVNGTADGATFPGHLPGFVATSDRLWVAISQLDAAEGVRLVGITP